MTDSTPDSGIVSRIIQVASDGYANDGVIEDVHALRDGYGIYHRDPYGVGDTLAEFIEHELFECCRDYETADEAWDEAIRVMLAARQQLDDIVNALTARRPGHELDT
jgi:hypothetical protein